jgi:hypothetical protein
MVLPQVSIAAMTVKSVYLYKKWRLPFLRRGIPIIIITSGYARFVGL